MHEDGGGTYCWTHTGAERERKRRERKMKKEGFSHVDFSLTHRQEATKAVSIVSDDPLDIDRYTHKDALTSQMTSLTLSFSLSLSLSTVPLLMSKNSIGIF